MATATGCYQERRVMALIMRGSVDTGVEASGCGNNPLAFKCLRIGKRKRVSMAVLTRRRHVLGITGETGTITCRICNIQILEEYTRKALAPHFQDMSAKLLDSHIALIGDWRSQRRSVCLVACCPTGLYCSLPRVSRLRQLLRQMRSAIAS